MPVPAAFDPRERTERHALPYIISSQAQKHVTHNEALRALDAMLHASLASRAATAPPDDPAPGATYLVPEGATGEWQDRAGLIVAFQEGAWMFHEPRAGFLAWVEDEAALLVHDGAGWIEIGGAGASATLGINASADDNNRLTVSSPGTLLTHEGDDHRLTINKAAPGDTGSLLFQTEWSGRAEMGLAGSDAWSLKVSPDGAIWREALRADADGSVSFPNGANAGHLLPGEEGEALLGAPNLSTVLIHIKPFALTAGQIALVPVLVDRPTVIEGAQAAVQTGGAGMLRAGLYRMGAPSGTAWRPGDRIADFGTAPADAAGHASFDLPAPITLETGWYLTALGTDADGVAIDALRCAMPGSSSLTAFGSGAGTGLRVAGPGVLLTYDGQGDAIANGLPTNWNADADRPIDIAGHIMLQPLMLRWRRWA